MIIQELPPTFEEFNQSYFPQGLATKDQLREILETFRLAYRKYKGHEDTIALRAKAIKTALGMKETFST
jgi:hypothetical protein